MLAMAIPGYILTEQAGNLFLLLAFELSITTLYAEKICEAGFYSHHLGIIEALF